MSRSPAALLLLALWIAGLVAAAAVVQRQLSIVSDLRLFLPAPATDEQRLLLEGFGEGPAARVLVVALAGAPTEDLAEISQALAESLRADESFRFVANGDYTLDAFPEALLPYRYLLSPAFDIEPLDERTLRAALTARARDLASPAGLLVEPWVARDPTLALLDLVERWQPTDEPRRELDVWFDRAGERALLLVETEAAAFDPDRQRAALERLEAAFAAVANGSLEMTVSGAGRFSVLMETRTREEAERLGATASVGMLLLLLIAYRSLGAVLLSVLPLLSAGLAGAAAVGAAFGSVHGITLAFGVTLIGVAQDYPLHLLSHRRGGRSPMSVARDLWPTLATGVVSTCIAYLTFLFSGVTGLQQLGCFAVVGLAVAGSTSRFVLPRLMAETAKRDHGDSAALGRLWHGISSVPRPRWAALVLAAACVATVLLAGTPFWDDDLQALTPVPAPLLAADQELRAELGTADLRYLLTVEAANEDAAIARLERLEPALAALVERGAIAGFDHAALYLPSAATQRARQAGLPDSAKLRAAVAAAAATTPFRPDAFGPFVADVEQARTLSPLTSEELRAHGLGDRVDLLLRPDARGLVALVTFTGVADVDAVRELAVSAGAGAALLDLKQASESLVARQRARILASLAVAAVLLAAVVAIALRSRERVLRVLGPMALATMVVVATLHAAGVSLTLFHLISLILAAGLGLDYALFFERAAEDPAEQRRTLHAILVCALSTLLVFALLATSSLPVLRAIGLPVAIGVVANFVLALLFTRPPEQHPSRV